MIAYDLKCANLHVFEGWFEDSKAFEDQQEKGLISCPFCNDTFVSKIPSTFAIKSSSQTADVPSNMAADQPDLAAIGEKVADFIEKNFDDVGSDFAKEALKIHYGVSEPRNIRGVSTTMEEETLKNEGIDFIKIPIPPPSDSDA